MIHLKFERSKFGGRDLKIHIGGGKLVESETVVAVFDMESATANGGARDFMRAVQRRGAVRELCADLPKSLVMVDETVYVSPSPATGICKRINEARAAGRFARRKGTE